jgi:hypothetical protein
MSTMTAPPSKMTTENPTFLRLMHSFKKELRRNLLTPILPNEEETITQFRALLAELKEPIQEDRAIPLLKKFLDILETNQEELDTQIDDEDDGHAAALQAEWDRLDRIAAKIDKFLNSIPPTTPPIKK